MKKTNLIIFVIILIVVVIIGIFVFKNYEGKVPVGENNVVNTDQPTETFNPESLSWEEAVVSAPWEGRDSHAVVVYKGKIWLMGGLDGTTRLISPGNIDYGNAPHFSDVWSSEDGKNWQLILSNAPWGERRSIQVVDFKGKMWLMGGWGPEVGYKNNIWSSEDGVKWKIESSSPSWSAREGHQLVVFKDKIWLIGGVKYTGQKLFNDVWYSSDGKNWEIATKSAEWSPRWDFSATAFDNKLWIAGGMAFGDEIFKDVWSSEDGVTWRLVNEKPEFGLRQGLSLVGYKEKLWVLSRLNIPLYGNGVNDVWYSSDGKNWEKTKEDPLWTGREDGGVVVFKDKIWIIGGMDKNWKWMNDVWYSTSNLDEKK